MHLAQIFYLGLSPWLQSISWARRDQP